MSAFIGGSRGTNSPHDTADVWASAGGVELRLFEGAGNPADGVMRSFDPVAARNLAALLVRASEEVERMRARASVESLNKAFTSVERMTRVNGQHEEAAEMIHIISTAIGMLDDENNMEPRAVLAAVLSTARTRLRMHGDELERLHASVAHNERGPQ